MSHPTSPENSPLGQPYTDPGDAPGPKILVTAGPTWEPIDQVRYLGNRSSGRMGIACAEAFAECGCPTTLLRGPATTPPREGVAMRQERFQSALDLETLLAELWPEHDILIMAAAVADFRPSLSSEEPPAKYRRASAPPRLELQAVPDLLGKLADTERPGQLRIGFALEPAEDLQSNARHKLKEKRLAGIVANPISTLDSDAIDGFFMRADGAIRRPADREIPKAQFARWLAREVLAIVP